MPRVYVPVSVTDVSALASAAEVECSLGFAVTPQLRNMLPQEDEEGLEHVATQFAAASAASDPVAVAVFDVSEKACALQDGAADGVPGAVHLLMPLRRRDLVCFLVGDPGESVSEDADLELSWYDAGEIAVVRAVLDGSSSA